MMVTVNYHLNKVLNYLGDGPLIMFVGDYLDHVT